MKCRMPKKYNDPKLSDSNIRAIIAEVTHKGRVDSWSISMIYGTDKGLFDSGILKQEGGYIVLAVAPVAVNEIDRQIEQAKQSIDPAIRLHGAMLAECSTGSSWWDDLIREDERLLVEENEERKVA